jgi:hypothetical protein
LLALSQRFQETVERAELYFWLEIMRILCCIKNPASNPDDTPLQPPSLSHLDSILKENDIPDMPFLRCLFSAWAYAKAARDYKRAVSFGQLDTPPDADGKVSLRNDLVLYWMMRFTETTHNDAKNAVERKLLDLSGASTILKVQIDYTEI